MTIDTIDKLRVLRDLGVKSYAQGEFSVEFFERPPPPAAPVPALGKGQIAADMCSCGHPLYAHVNGACTMAACTPKQCGARE